jgi:DNA (cytosine-5)-methyltransferase 1
MGRIDAETETLIPTRQGGFFDDRQPIAFDSKRGSEAGELSPTLRSMTHDKSHQNGGGQVAIAIRTAQTSSNGCEIDENGKAYTLDGAQGQAVQQAMSVRRLTVRECERLQSWPDDSTLNRAVLKLEGNIWHPTGKVIQQADGPRYKQIGNGVTSVVAEWLGVRTKRFSV